MENNDNQINYNKFIQFPQVSYNIATYLLNNDDTIWRLLKYDSADAWNENVCPNLTKKEKGDLIWAGEGDQTDYRIFFDSGQDYSWTKRATIIRMFPSELIPINYVYGAMSFDFEIYTFYELSTMSNYATRNITVLQRIIEVLNGASIDGVGLMYFDAKASPRCRISAIGAIPYRGYRLTMCNKIVG
jgi:hypothetical protein